MNSSLQFHLGLWGLLYILYSFHGDYKPTNITGGVPPGMFNVSGTCFFYRSRTAQTDFKNCPEHMVGFQSHGDTPIARWMVYFNLFHGKSQSNSWMRTGGSPFFYGNLHMAVCQNLVPLVNIKIAGKWMFIPLKMVLIGIDPYPYGFDMNSHPLAASMNFPGLSAKPLASPWANPLEFMGFYGDVKRDFTIFSVMTFHGSHSWEFTGFYADSQGKKIREIHEEPPLENPWGYTGLYNII